MSELEALKDKVTQLEHLVETWFFETFQGSIVARTTEVWNAVHAGKQDLQTRIAELLAYTPND